MDFLAPILPSSAPRPRLNPLPGTVPLTLEAILYPPLLYYVALLFLPPLDPRHPTNTTLIPFIRNTLALIAGILFFRLPLLHYVHFSIGLTYHLALVGLYGGCRVLDAFFISPYLLGHVPRRVTFIHHIRPETPGHRLQGRCATHDTKADYSYFDDLMDGCCNDHGLSRCWRRLKPTMAGRILGGIGRAGVGIGVEHAWCGLHVEHGRCEAYEGNLAADDSKFVA